jgi:hypothetical protein
MKKNILVAALLFGIVGCVNVGGGNSSGGGGQQFNTFKAGDIVKMLTTPMSYSTTSTVNPDVYTDTSCYTMGVSGGGQRQIVFYPTSTCYSVATGSGLSPAYTNLEPRLKNPLDVPITIAMDESYNAYIGVKGQTGTPNYLLKCTTVNNGAGGTCYPAESYTPLLPKGATGSIAQTNGLINDGYGRLYTIGTCLESQVGDTPGQQCIYMSNDGANTWNSITNGLANAQAGQNRLPSLQMWNLLPNNQPLPNTGGSGGSVNVNISYLDPVTKVRLSYVYFSNVPQTVNPADPSSYGYSWGMSMYGAGGVLPVSSAAINPNTSVIYSAAKSTAGNPNYGQVGYIGFYAQGIPPNNPNIWNWRSESVTYSDSNPNPAGRFVTNVSVDNASHVYFTLSDGTSYYGAAPR